VVLAPVAAAAQTPLPDPSVDLLKPSLQGNPANPPRFRRAGDPAGLAEGQAPPVGTFTAPSRIGATPIYGSPTGFGAADTGYDSKNRSRRKRLAQTPGAPAPGAPAPETTFAPLPTSTITVPPKPPVKRVSPPAMVYPVKAAARPGAVLPPPADPIPISNPPPEVHPLSAASRPGAVAPVPPPYDPDASAATPPPGLPLPNTLPLGTVPQRALPLAEGDPYAALGIRGGSFLFLPAVELSAGYDNNPQHAPGGPGSSYFIVAPELLVQSNWSRHSLTADIRGSYTDYGNNDLTPSLNRPYLYSKIDGRIDVTRQTQIELENRFIVATDNPGSPNLQAGLARLPVDTTVGGTLGIAHQFNRLDVSVKGTVDRSTYNNSTLTDGESVSNDDRNFNQYGGILRIGYEIDPALKPFVEVSEDSRVYDLQFDSSGLQRDSTGSSGKVGATIDLFGSLTGEIAVGYMQRVYKDPTLPNVGGAIADGALIWQATPLTTARLTAASTINESVLPGVSGDFSRDFSLQVDHALRRWLIGTLIVGYGRDMYVGSSRDDNRYFASAGLTYKLTRSMQIKTTVRHDWLTSTQTGAAYNATSALVTLRLQR
jgi:hypothetical protein